MTNLKDGDRVTVTISGTVVYAYDEFIGVKTDGGEYVEDILVNIDTDIRVEVHLPALPTNKGAVIRHKDTGILFGLNGQVWVAMDATQINHGWAALNEHRAQYQVLFEGYKG